MSTAEEVFISYLDSEGISYKCKGEGLALALFVNKNFDVLDDKILRKLVTLALAERDKNVEKGVATADLLGKWGEIIDAVKEVTLERREMAEKNFIKATQIGRVGKPKEVITFLYELFKSGCIDFLFRDVLQTTITTLRNQPDSDEAVAMYEFFQAVIEKAKTECVPVKVTTSTITNNTNTSTKAINVTDGKVSKENNDKIDNNNDNNDHEDDNDDEDNDDIDSDDEIEEHRKQVAEKEKQKKMDTIGVFINDLIKSVPNHPPDELKARLLAECTSGRMNPELVLHVLSEYINACQAAGYANKIKLLEFWKTSVENEMKNNTPSSNTRYSLFISIHTIILLSLFIVERMRLPLHIMHHSLLMLIIISRCLVKH